MTAQARTRGDARLPPGRAAVVREGRARPVALSPDGIAAVTTAVGRLTGLPTADAELLKFTNNAVVRLPRAGAVLRIAGSQEVRAKVPVVLATARWLEALRLPAVRLLPDVPQPIEAAGHLATMWRAVEHGETDVSGDALATVLREWHTIDAPPPAGLPAWNLMAFVRRRVEACAGVADDDLAFLHGELARVEGLLAGLPDLEPLLPPGVLHGDAFLGNVVPSPQGPVICDFDGVSIGPREWDLVPVAVGALRFDYTAGLHESFARTYGVDVTTWTGFPAMRALRELQLVTSVLPTLEANPALRPQWRFRLDSLRRADDSVRWTPYPAAPLSR
jgi:hypothetical protein